ncbi:MAG: sugar phosphate nucleotidyltransferase, partial [Acholeplasmataceae bacterium]
MIKKAVIPAAGYGTRFLPITKALPKELLPIIDRPTIEYIVDEAIKSGITDILLIVSSNKNAIIDYFDYNIELETILLSKNKQEEYHLVRDIAR